MHRHFFGLTERFRVNIFPYTTTSNYPYTKYGLELMTVPVETGSEILAVKVTLWFMIDGVALLARLVEVAVRCLTAKYGIIDRVTHDDTLTQAQSQLGTASFQAAYNEGKKLEIEQVVKQVLYDSFLNITRSE